MILVPVSSHRGDRPFHEMVFGKTGIAVDRLENRGCGLPKTGSESVSEKARRPGLEAETEKGGFLILHGPTLAYIKKNNEVNRFPRAGLCDIKKATMSQPAGPLISVCIPSYNNANFIGPAIDSVLNQTLDDFELVIVDDLSPDGTREKIRAYSDPRLRVIENDRNLGHEENWNKALRGARGRFVKILPGDDLLHPRCLEKQRDAFEDASSGEVALVSCARDIIDETGRKILKRSFPGKGGLIPGLEAVRRCVRAGTNLIGEPAAVLMRADMIARTGAFDGANLYVIDLDYWVRLLLHGSLKVIGESLCGFRVSRTAVSTRIRSSQSLDFKAFIERLGRDPRFGITRRDIRRGKIRASGNEVLRRILYRIVFPK